jgi:F-box-like
MASSRPATRRQKQLQSEAVFFLPSAQVSSVCSHLPAQHLVAGAALVCKRWREVIATDPVAWTTAVRDLDPCASLGGAALIAAAAKLLPRGRASSRHVVGGGVAGREGWLTLAARLGSSSCSRKDCPMWACVVNEATMTRLCRAHSEGPFVLNKYLFSAEPWAEVGTEEELRSALKAAHAGAYIAMTQDIYLESEVLDVSCCRLGGRRMDNGRRPRLRCGHTVLCTRAMLDSLIIRSGDNPFELGEPDYLPGVECADSMLLFDCDILAQQVIVWSCKSCADTAQNVHPHDRCDFV